jgi:hypothetical protein
MDVEEMFAKISIALNAAPMQSNKPVAIGHYYKDM